MAVDLTFVPASGAGVSRAATRITVTGASTNDPATYDVDDIPTEESIPYRIVASKTGQDDLVSHEFVVSSAGLHTWDNVMFPASGAWTVKVIDQRDDSIAHSESYTAG